ncbi:MAG: hypothetical protein RBR13_07330 [Tenuifilaceae bacterium]|nr:hypothetical protein [Tenuifilaceae bacterium]
MKAWKSALWNLTKWLLVAAYLITSLNFVGKRSDQVTCSSISINIADSLDNAFITTEEVLKKIEREHANLIGIPISMINTHAIEQQITTMQGVKRAEAYKTNNGVLSIDIEQRKPVMRIINRYGKSYYIDIEGRILPLSNSFTSHVLVINGNITEPFEIKPDINIMSWGKQPTEDEPFICQLYTFAKFVTSHPFWNAQITQVYVNNEQNIELIPRVGPHTIIFGDLANYEKKLAKLKLFYQSALPEEGWNKYTQINLRYSNQVVCTKR